MADCIYHPGVAAEATCSVCAHPLCGACWVEFMGAPHCGPCRDQRLAAMQAPGFDVSGGGRLAGTGTVDLGDWLGTGWKVFAANPAGFILATLITFLLTGFSCGLAWPGFACGMVLMAFVGLTQGPAAPGTLWEGFRRYLHAALLCLLTGGIVAVVTGAVLVSTTSARLLTPNLSGLNELNTLAPQVTALVVSVVVLAPTFFALPMIACRNANPVEALEASWRVFMRNPGGFLLTALVLELIRLVGNKTCLGVFLVFPWTFAVQAKAYYDHFGLRDWVS